MPNLGTYIPNNCQGHIGNHIAGGWAAFPVNTPVVVKNVTSPVTKGINGTIEIHASAAWLNGNPNEVRDTLIFEGINVINKPNLDAAQNNFENSNQTLAAYGRAYSDIEADTGWRAGHIFDDMANAGIGLSNWGTDIRNTAINSLNLVAFQNTFATTAQDPHAADQRQMHSEDLYQFEWVSRKGQEVISRKIRDQWLLAQINRLSTAGAVSARDRMFQTIRSLTDAISQYPAGKKGRVEKYNAALVALSINNQLNPLPGFLNTPPYLCPTY